MTLTYLKITFVLAALVIMTDAAECPNYCDVDQDTQLVCGQSSLTGEIRTFKNKCQMERNNCAGDEKHYVMSFGECPDEVPPCNRLCIGIDDPVCTVSDFGGYWGNFTSECELIVTNCVSFPGSRIVSKGYCPSDCPPCGNDRNYDDPLYKTACGRYANGKILKFNSTCELILENCRNPSAKIEKLADSACEDTKDRLVFH